MKLFAALITIVVLGVTGLCRADEQAAVLPQSGDTSEAGRPLKAVLSDSTGNQFTGSVVWHIGDVVSPGQPSALAVRADVEIPALGMTVKLDLRRNDDLSLPASHMVELVFTLPPDFPHGKIANVPGILMKAGETARGVPLNGVAVKVTDKAFTIGLSSVEADRQRNIQLMKERSWVDVAVVYDDHTRAILAVERAPLNERALAVLESPADRLRVASPAPAPPDRLLPLDAVLNYTALSSTAVPQVRARPLWSWPPMPLRWSWMPLWWSWMPWSLTPSWTWQLWSQTKLPGTIKLASTIVLATAPKPPSWLQAMSVLTTAGTPVPQWRHVRAPDFHLPTGPSRVAVRSKYLEPPARFVHWSDRIETVLPIAE
jgi:hypothetical protein